MKQFATPLAALLALALCAPASAAERNAKPARKTSLAGAGMEIGAVYEAWLSPQQEGGEEEDTPAATPAVFRSTTPSTPREQRKSRGYGTISFSKDLSRAWVKLEIEGVKIQEINMFHLHCGRPGQLGPILVDFGVKDGAKVDLPAAFAKGMFEREVKNADITAVTEHSHGAVDFATKGCPIVQTLPQDRVKNIAGMEYITSQGELYFNLHTTSQTYFGDIRGVLKRIK
ncbi:CHRD domain-containing protein [Massilia sp. W12]|uniref:CHRD domain-containing protein n=1 Tax=Massilia sp. W12 TaxID=3126507 RepID=UPI0030D09992